MEATAEAGPSRGRELKAVRDLVSDLRQPRAAIYWTDLLLSAGLGWTAFALAVAGGGGLPAVAAMAVAVPALYRAVLFIHELSHLPRSALPGFRAAWNLLVGIPTLVPSFTYVGVHPDHHRHRLYGTPRDPEYLPLGRGPRRRVLLFLAEPLLMPLAFAVRFLILAPAGLLVPRFHRLLERRASSLAINLAYVRRPLSREERRRMMALEAGILVFWGAGLLLVSGGFLPLRILPLWYLLSAGVAFMNQVRTLGAHRYRSGGGELTVEEQLLDSVNVPAGPLTGLWAPVGLRYHALHHYLPDVPYHALGAAHRRLMASLPDSSPYRRVNHRSLGAVLRALWRGPGPEAGRLLGGGPRET